MRAKVEVVNSTGVIAAVRNRHAEIGFVEGLDSLEGLHVVDLHRDHIVVVARSHRWGRRRSLAPADLAGEPYLTREAGSGTRAVATAGLARIGVELTPSLEAASAQSIKRALNAGGFALLSELAVETERRAGTLNTLTVRGLDLARDLRAIRDPRRRLPAASQRFWDWLQQPSQQHSKTSFLRTLVHPSCLRSDRGTALARAARDEQSLHLLLRHGHGGALRRVLEVRRSCAQKGPSITLSARRSHGPTSTSSIRSTGRGARQRHGASSKARRPLPSSIRMVCTDGS